VALFETRTFEGTHLDQRPDSQERTSTSSSRDCIGASIGVSFDAGDVFGASLIVSPSLRFEFDVTRGSAADAAAELNGTLNGTRNCAVLLSTSPIVSHTKYANLRKGGMAPTITSGRSRGLAPGLLRGLLAAALFRIP